MIEEVRFAADSPLQEAVSSELVSEMPNSLRAGKIQGISSIHGLVARIYRQNGMSGQALTVKFPVRMNREFFETIRELDRRIREIPGRIREGAFRSRFDEEVRFARRDDDRRSWVAGAQ